MNQDLVQADTLLEAKARREELLAFRQLVNQYIDQHIKDLESIKDLAIADRNQTTVARERTAELSGPVQHGPVQLTQPSPASIYAGHLLIERINKLPWRAGKRGNDFEWCFNTDRSGAQIKETKELLDLVTTGGGKFSPYNDVHEYTISKDRKFLQRVRHKGVRGKA